MLCSKHYFIAQINSSKAYQFTSVYHYSHTGHKKANVNLGIFKKSNKEMVGVTQWGVSGQDAIRLDRYVKEPITNKEYLELNRFCMTDGEGKNAESEAIGLAIKWIKQNLPHIRLLVSYSGRKEGNYGYIYQATNWEYLGYFLSSGFWQLDGEERHQITAWYRYHRNCKENLSFTDGLCSMYHDVRRTTSKQFIYIQRLDKTLTPAEGPYAYPKPATEFPIVTDVKIFKEDNDFLAKLGDTAPKPKCFYAFEEESLQKHGVAQSQTKYVIYGIDGMKEEEFLTSIAISEHHPEYLQNGIRLSIKEGRRYKNKYFKKFNITDDIPLQIDVETLCYIDEIPFYTMPDIVKYCGVTKQAVQQSKKKRGKTLAGKPVHWCFEE